MAVFRRKDSGSQNWFIDFTHLGQAVRRSSGVTAKAQAQEIERQWRQEITDRVRLGKAPSITLGEAAARYYETVLKKPGAKKAKLDRDLVYLKQIRDQFGCDMLLTNIKPHDVAKWRDELVRGERKLKPSSANRLVGLLRAIINRARDDWHVDAAEWKLKQLREGPARIRYLDEANEQALLTALPSHVREFVTFLMDSGCRKGEAEALTWNRITWNGDRATVLLFATDTKTDRARHVPLTMRASAILRRLHERYHNHQFVFMYERGGETRRIGNVRKPFETALARANIKPCGGDDFVIHDCRHHFASRLVQKAVSLQRVKELLGHASIKTTERYAHLVRLYR